eukprot:1281407-Amorphochlora_amoeboformis.AAC.1
MVARSVSDVVLFLLCLNRAQSAPTFRSSGTRYSSHLRAAHSGSFYPPVTSVSRMAKLGRLKFKASEAVEQPASRTTDTELVRWVQDRLFTEPGGAFLRDPAALSEDVKLTNPLWRMQGRTQYVKSATAWYSNSEKELPEAKTVITEMVEPVIGQNTVRIRWETTWVPPKLMWWAKVQKVFPPGLDVTLMAVGEPMAVIYGVTTMEFQSNATEPNRFQLIKQVDQLELEKVFSADRVKKRRLASHLYEDLVSFLTTRRPLGWDAKEWSDRILAMLDLSAVSRQRATSNANNVGKSPAERAQMSRRGQLGIGLGLVAAGCATVA